MYYYTIMIRFLFILIGVGGYNNTGSLQQLNFPVDNITAGYDFLITVSKNSDSENLLLLGSVLSPPVFEYNSVYGG